MLRGTLKLYGKAWILAYCIGLIECLEIIKMCFAMQWWWVIRMWKKWRGTQQVPIFCMGYHVYIMQCMQPNFLLTGQMYPMLTSSVPQAWGTLGRKVVFLNWLYIFSEGCCFYVLAWYCVCTVSLLCNKFWACLDLKYSSSGWKCMKVSTVPHLPLHKKQSL